MRMRSSFRYYLQFPLGLNVGSIKTWAKANGLIYEIIIKHDRHTALLDVDTIVGNNWSSYFLPDNCVSYYFFKDEQDAFTVKLVLS